MQTNIRDLKEKGFAVISYPADVRNAVEKAAAAWIKFCALPNEVKRGLPYSNNSDGVGYELKDGVGKAADRKENFDVTLAGEEWLVRNAEKIKDPTALEFVGLAVKIVPLLEPLLLSFARDVEREFGIKGFADEAAAGMNAVFVRFIHNFEGGIPGEEITASHPDQSGFTPHLFANAEGLRFYGLNGEWLDVPVSAEETVIIPAMQLQLRSGGELKAITHNVIATEETARAGRYSGVCFVQLKNTPKYDKERWGRLQEMIQDKGFGFNYEMPQQEFAKLFKK